MSSEIDVLPNAKQALVLEAQRAEAALATTRTRDVVIQHRTHSELIQLVQRLFLNGSQSPQAVVFSAVERGSGCTFVCTHTAAILANQLEEPVCIVDANFRSPGLDQQLALPEAKASNLFLLSYKPESTRRSRLAGLDRFRTLIEDLRKNFSYIIIDAPPLDECSDAAGFARAADGLVLVIQANSTRREVGQHAKSVLDAGGVSVLGAVLNKRAFPIPESVYRRL